MSGSRKKQHRAQCGGLEMSALGYDPSDPLAAPSGGSGRGKTEDYGLGDDGWHRFGLLHPDGYDDKQHITIAVKHHGEEISPWDKKNIRPKFEVKVGKGENQVMPSGGGEGYPYWGSSVDSGLNTSHRDVAQGVAMSLGSDAQDIDLPLEHRSLYDHGTTEENYPWAMGREGKSSPYSEPEKDFMREHADRLARAGREDYDLEQDGEEPTLINLDSRDGGHAGSGHSRYGTLVSWSNALRVED